MSLKPTVGSVARRVLARLRKTARSVLVRLRKEPVAVWGSLLGIVLVGLDVAGVPQSTLTAVGAALSVLGVPVVRAKVTPTPTALFSALRAWASKL